MSGYLRFYIKVSIVNALFKYYNEIILSLVISGYRLYAFRTNRAHFHINVWISSRNIYLEFPQYVRRHVVLCNWIYYEALVAH